MAKLKLEVAWTALDTTWDEGRDGGDPLGLRAAAERLARVLAPGLTQRSYLTRGFSLLAAGLEVARRGSDRDDGPDVDERFQRFERLERLVVGQ